MVTMAEVLHREILQLSQEIRIHKPRHRLQSST